jgi:hypothetical protein
MSTPFGTPPPAPLTERDMLDRLARRYAKTARNGTWIGPQYLRAEHVANALSWRRTRIADFIAVNMHSEDPRSGLYLHAPVFHGHEVKVSRADWLAELRDPAKAQAFTPFMHYWWLVVSDRAIVRDDLPEGWGLMVASGDKLRAVVKPTPRTPEPMPPGLIGALMRATVTTEARYATTCTDCPTHGRPTAR